MKKILPFILIFISCVSQKQPSSIENIDSEKESIEKSSLLESYFELKKGVIKDSKEEFLYVWSNSEIKKIRWFPLGYDTREEIFIYLKNGKPILIKRYEVDELQAILTDDTEQTVLFETEVSYYIFNWRQRNVHTIISKNDNPKKINFDFEKYEHILDIAKEKINTGNTIYSK